MRVRDALIAAVLVAGGATPTWAQQGSGPPSSGPKPPQEEPELKFDREFFVYPMDGRRDPFESLAGRTDLGPRFEELTLRGIIYSPAGQSVALIADASGKIYRLRRGDSVGTARIVTIAERHVVLAVEIFGVVRQEQLELKREAKEGVNP